MIQFSSHAVFMTGPTIHSRVAVARERLANAERELDGALAELRVLPRAAKQGVTAAVTTAMDELRVAAAILAELEASL